MLTRGRWLVLTTALAVLGMALLVTWMQWLSRYRGVDHTDVRTFFGDHLVPSARGSFGEGNLTLLEEGPLGRILRVRYPKGSASPTVHRDGHAPLGGAQLYLRLRKPVDTLYLRYYVRFPKGFDYVKGGKLPGLFGGTVTGGRRSPDGTDGFSTRYMWRRDGAGEVYAYLATSRGEGTSLGRSAWRFRPGEWHLLEQEVTLNQPSRPDGRVRVWLDGHQVLDEAGLRFRTVGDLRIEGLFFSTFFGGSDRSWSTPRDTYVDFAAFAVGSHVGPTHRP
jgi:polysaccharide lyase-like protein